MAKNPDAKRKGLVVDHAAEFLRNLKPEQRIPKFGENGLPPPGTPLTRAERDQCFALGAPRKQRSLG
jgi:hypothetical protein